MAQRATPIPIGDPQADPKVQIDANGNVTGGGTINNGGVLKIDVDAYPAGYNQCQVSVAFVAWGNTEDTSGIPGGTIKVGS
jgi:hypothetical protein